MHRLLKRQLKRSFAEGYQVPEDMRGLIDAVDEAYRQYDSDLTMMERSLELSSTELLQTNLEMRAVFQALPNIFLRLDEAGTILDCRSTEISEVFSMWKGLVGKPIEQMPSPTLGRQFAEAIATVQARQSVERFEYPLEVNGNNKFYEARLVPMPGNHMTVIMRDLTGQMLAEEKRRTASAWLEETNRTLLTKIDEIETLNEHLTSVQNQLLQSQEIMHTQKMESVGQLAGGVAHDLNNILQVIMGHIQMAMQSCAPEEPLYEDLEKTIEASDRAAALVKQLLAFGKKQFLHPKIMNINDDIRELMGLLRRIIKENVEIEFIAESETDRVNADATVLDQVLLNLCINARDAMPDGGKLTIHTCNVVEDNKKYLLISLSDTGPGIPAEHLDHIFEPFFTTKESRKGTGLGLAVAYGVVTQHRGMIKAEPNPSGIGTTFKVWLPTAEEGAENTEEQKPVRTPSRREGSTVLLAEDERRVQELAVRMLEKGGFNVLPASDGEEAIQIFEANADTIDLVLLDVIMPKLGGRGAFECISKLKPDIPVLFCSGYGDKDIDFIGELGLRLISKPYGYEGLLQFVHEALDG